MTPSRPPSVDAAVGEAGPEPRSAMLLGATGLVGGHCLRQLLQEPAYTRVHALVRRPLGKSHPRLVEHVVDFDRLGETAGELPADDVFCCLGTTIGAAGSRDVFRRVDHDYVVAAARLALESGAKRFLLVSALGADERSRIFYNRVKGEAERDVAALGFRGVVILRPSLLMGDRTERRRGEEIGKVVTRVIGPLFVGPLRRYRGIRAETVARAMVRQALGDPTGVRFLESDEIARIGA
jgi:uncharacterized protein YbjT (DUF2867 family)